MSLQTMEDAKKVDASFYNGYIDIRYQYRKYVFIHFFEAVMFTVFIPIDSTILTVGNRMITALVIGLADSVISLLIMAYVYYKLFGSGGVRKFLYLAHQLNHITNEQNRSPQTIEDCASNIMLYQPDLITLQDLDEKTIKIYSNIAKFEISAQLNSAHRNLQGILNIYKFLSLLSMILIIVFMILSKNMNPAEIVVLIVFLVLQTYLKSTLFFILLLIVLSPLICIIAMIYCCCCAPKNQEEGSRVLNLDDRPAGASDLVKSGGQCSVCLMDIKIGQHIYTLPCSQKHIFHKGCLKKWSMVSFTCPNCRAALPTISAQQKGLQLPGVPLSN